MAVASLLLAAQRVQVACGGAVDIRIEGTTVVVTFSRRNLHALLHRLDHYHDPNYTLFRNVGGWTVRVHAESDERHYTQRPIDRAPDPVATAQIEEKARKFPPLASTHWLFDGRTQCPVCQQVFKRGDELAMWTMTRREHLKTKEAAVVHWGCVPDGARETG